MTWKLYEVQAEEGKGRKADNAFWKGENASGFKASPTGGECEDGELEGRRHGDGDDGDQEGWRHGDSDDGDSNR